MIIMSRRKNESVVIGDDIVITVVEVLGDKVRLGVVHPKDVPVHRQEVFETIHGLSPPEPPPRSPEETAFLRAILEAPDDEAIRLIFADWLEERGDPYGEFIRIQCGLAKLPPEEPRRQTLVEREHLLWERHAPVWRSYLLPILRTAAFAHGFVEAIHLTAAEFLANAEAIFAAAPVRHLRVRRPWPVSARVSVAALAASPHLARLTGLDWSGQELGDGGAAVLAASPHVAGFRSLVLRQNGIGDGGAAALADSPRMSGLTTLDLAGNRIGGLGVTVLATSQHLAGQLAPARSVGQPARGGRRCCGAGSETGLSSDVHPAACRRPGLA